MDILQPEVRPVRKPNPQMDSDQSEDFKGIREVAGREAGDGQFVEPELNPSLRRDPEEARHNEAGTPMVTQADIEIEKTERIKSERR